MTDWFKLLLPYWGSMRLRNELLRRDPKPLLVLYPFSQYRVKRIGGVATDWRYCIVELHPDRFTIYPRTRSTQEQITFQASWLRWFGRPEKYHDGHNDIWLHMEHDETWTLLELSLPRSEMTDFVRTLKTLADEDMVKAYRRQRPYVHYGSVQAYPAHQDIHGAWKLDDWLLLYLTPLHLVIMRGDHVLRAVPLSQIQQIAALQRLDKPSEDGLVRFRVEGEEMAFALDKHQVFADKLAEAARRSLEEPLMQKQKAYDEEWE